MNGRKFFTAVAAASIGLTLTLTASGPAFAGNNKPERIEKTFKDYKPFPNECYAPVLASSGDCLILF